MLCYNCRRGSDSILYFWSLCCETRDLQKVIGEFFHSRPWYVYAIMSARGISTGRRHQGLTNRKIRCNPRSPSPNSALNCATSMLKSSLCLINGHNKSIDSFLSNQAYANNTYPLHSNIHKMCSQIFIHPLLLYMEPLSHSLVGLLLCWSYLKLLST